MEWQDLEESQGLISDLDDRDTALWRYVNAIGDLERETEENDWSKNNNSQIAGKADLDPRTVKKKGKKLQEKGFIELDEGKTDQNLTTHKLTDKGWDLYRSIQNLFTPLEKIREAVEEFHSKTLRYPDTKELREEFDLIVSPTKVSQLDDWSKPDEKEKEKKAKLLREVLKIILASRLTRDNLLDGLKEMATRNNHLTWDEGDFEIVENYWDENEDIIEEFNVRQETVSEEEKEKFDASPNSDDLDAAGRKFVCEVPSELKPYSRKDELEFGVRPGYIQATMDTHFVAKFPKSDEIPVSFTPDRDLEDIEPEFEYKWPIEPIRKYIKYLS